MKKFLLILTFCLLIFTCVGCSNDDEDTIDISGITFESEQFDYDGQAHSIKCENIPNGITVKYFGNGPTNPGTHLVTAVLKDSEGNEVGRLTATIKINESDYVDPDDGNEEDGNGDVTDPDDPEDTPSDEETTILTLVPGWWDSDDAWFALYWWNDSENGWIILEDDLSVEVPEGVSNVIFCRMNASATDMEWGSEGSHVWNQTVDLVIPDDGSNTFTIAGWEYDIEGKSTGDWS